MRIAMEMASEVTRRRRSVWVFFECCAVAAVLCINAAAHDGCERSSSFCLLPGAPAGASVKSLTRVISGMQLSPVQITQAVDTLPETATANSLRQRACMESLDSLS